MLYDIPHQIGLIKGSKLLSKKSANWFDWLKSWVCVNSFRRVSLEAISQIQLAFASVPSP
jgi:hypothetical protein